jgi:DNA-binding NarL/FixJ family response regulator
MIDRRRLSIASSAEAVSSPVAAFTPYECMLTWCVLTLLHAHNTPSRERHLPAASPPHGSHLTAREIEVLSLVALGLTNAQIAARLFLSRRTVDQHLSSIYNRLGVSSRTAATRFAILNNLC